MNEGIKFLRVGTARHFTKPEELADHGNIFTEEIIQKVMSKDNSQFFLLNMYVCKVCTQKKVGWAKLLNRHSSKSI